MPEDDFRSRSFAPPRHAPAKTYPVAQWHHQRNGVVGGLEIPVRFFPEAALTLPDPLDVPHGPRSESAWILPSFHLAIVGLRPVLWERRRGEIVETAPADLESPWESGYRSRRRLLVVIKELWEASYKDFVVATFKATTSQDLAQILFSAERFRTSAGQSASGAAYPEYAFWLPLRAGQSQQVYSQDGSQSSYVSPLEGELPEPPTAEDLQRLMIPLDVQSFIEARLDEVESWERGENAGGEPWPRNSHAAGAGEPEETGEDPGEAGETLESPATQARPATPTPSPRRRAPSPQGNGNGTPADALRVPAPVGTRKRPDYRGWPLGDLLMEGEGRKLVRYLATRFRPQDARALEAVKAAQALVAAGLAG